MLEDAILLNMQSIRDGDKLNLIPATSLNNYIVNHTSKLVPANGTPLVNFSPPSL